MTIAPPAFASGLAGMSTATRGLDVAAHNVANANTDPYAPLRADGTPGEPGGLDLPGEMVATLTAPVVYAANARVVRAEDEILGSLLDVRA